MDWDYYNRKEKHAGRPAKPWYLKWIDSLRVTAWYSYLESSGLDFKSIDLSFHTSAEFEGKKISYDYNALDRQWRFWRNGIGTVKKEVLEEVEKYIPGSMEVYAVGPDGARLWLTYLPETNVETEIMFFKNPLPVDSHFRQIDSLNNRKFEHVSMADFSDDEITSIPITGLGTAFNPESPWFEITFALLSYRLRCAVNLRSYLPTDDPNLSDAVERSGVRAEVNLLRVIKKYSDTIQKYGMHPCDLIYTHSSCFVTMSAGFAENIECEFNTREDSAIWNKISQGLIDYKS